MLMYREDEEDDRGGGGDAVERMVVRAEEEEDGAVLLLLALLVLVWSVLVVFVSARDVPAADDFGGLDGLSSSSLSSPSPPSSSLELEPDSSNAFNARSATDPAGGALFLSNLCFFLLLLLPPRSRLLGPIRFLGGL